jgi:hypothetical protein
MKLFTWPNKPVPGQRLTKYLEILNIPWTQDTADPDISWLMHYNYSNREDSCPDLLRKMSFDLEMPIINESLLNIRKDYVDDVFTEVFGYSLRLDPTQHWGMCIEKSTQNAIHRGRFIQCPITPGMIDRKVYPSKSGEPHVRMYVKMIDTRIDEETIRDFRVAVMGAEPVALFEKHLGMKSFFHPFKENKFEAFAFDNMTPYFSDYEIDQTKMFIKKMGIEFAEIDILRDNSTGLMYIIDVNPVPAGGLFNLIGGPFVEKLANTFKTMHLL